MALVRKSALRTRRANDADFRTATLVSVFRVDRIDAATPWPVEFFEQLFGRRDAARDEILDRPQVPALVVAPVVDVAAARQPALGHPQRILREAQHIAIADLGLEPEPRHVVAQLLPLLCAPVLHQVPGGVERVVVVENAGPE